MGREKKGEKLCVFCGQPPDIKNMEHVIPKWLIQMTGNPKRQGRFGHDMRKNTDRLYAFDQFRFPACTKCNSRFSTLEHNAKRVVETMLCKGLLAEADINILLDWLDKVRVGLWLAFLYLDKNPLGIEPEYHIETRIGANDRFVVICQTDYPKQFLSFIGPDFPAFQYTPSCFALLVNNL